ncbi:hypothetical protein K7432_000941 [Basidiobolus ranarum]|uniref:At4g15545-like C-terminal domain-containing protein n=1 Tax=Basidiobolus ranarum TaxID=34480 RepID=A0ABR2WAD7_9FUNG
MVSKLNSFRQNLVQQLANDGGLDPLDRVNEIEPGTISDLQEELSHQLSGLNVQDIPDSSPIDIPSSSDNSRPLRSRASNSGQSRPSHSVRFEASSLRSNEPDSTRMSSSVNGKDFFRKARRILSYDEFTSLISNVKAYNSREQTKARTINNVSRILLPKYSELYSQFENLIT